MWLGCVKVYIIVLVIFWVLSFLCFLKLVFFVIGVLIIFGEILVILIFVCVNFFLRDCVIVCIVVFVVL